MPEDDNDVLTAEPVVVDAEISTGVADTEALVPASSVEVPAEQAASELDAYDEQLNLVGESEEDESSSAITLETASELLKDRGKTEPQKADAAKAKDAKPAVKAR